MCSKNFACKITAFFLTYANFWLQKYLHTVNLIYAHITHLANFVRIEQFDGACALIVIIAEGDAVIVMQQLSGVLSG